MSSKVTIVMYHYVRDVNRTAFPGIKARSVKEFENQILFFKKNYNIISIDTLLSAIFDTGALPTNPVLLTFDDGYIDHYTNVFPMLRKHNIFGCFYPSGKAIDEKIVLDVNKIHFILALVHSPEELRDEVFSKLDEYRKEYNLKSNEYYYKKLCVPNKYDGGNIIFVKRLLQKELPPEVRKDIINSLFIRYVTTDEKDFSEQLYMSADNLREMTFDGMHVGSHCYDHYWLDTLSLDKQKDEIGKSLHFLQTISGEKGRWTICYPYGAYNEDTLILMEKFKCSAGFTVGERTADLSVDDMFILPRLDTNQLPVR